MFEKLLILEGSWAQDPEHYIADSRSTTRIYSGFESLLSVQSNPVFIIARPLLKSRFDQDIGQFLDLPGNQKGLNVIILSGHGYYKKVKDEAGKMKHRRVLFAIDGKMNLSRRIRKLSRRLCRTIFILDACDVGTSISSFRDASSALGVIGFKESVDWIDSSVFILALLLRYQAEGIFQMKRLSAVKPQRVLEDMRDGSYRSLWKRLDLKFSFDGKRLRVPA